MNMYKIMGSLAYDFIPKDQIKQDILRRIKLHPEHYKVLGIAKLPKSIEPTNHYHIFLIHEFDCGGKIVVSNRLDRWRMHKQQSGSITLSPYLLQYQIGIIEDLFNVSSTTTNDGFSVNGREYNSRTKINTIEKELSLNNDEGTGSVIQHGDNKIVTLNTGFETIPYMKTDSISFNGPFRKSPKYIKGKIEERINKYCPNTIFHGFFINDSTEYNENHTKIVLERDGITWTGTTVSGFRKGTANSRTGQLSLEYRIYLFNQTKLVDQHFELSIVGDTNTPVVHRELLATCSCGHEWSTDINKCTQNHDRCDECYGEKRHGGYVVTGTENGIFYYKEIINKNGVVIAVKPGITKQHRNRDSAQKRKCIHMIRTLIMIEFIDDSIPPQLEYMLYNDAKSRGTRYHRKYGVIPNTEMQCGHSETYQVADHKHILRILKERLSHMIEGKDYFIHLDENDMLG